MLRLCKNVCSFDCALLNVFYQIIHARNHVCSHAKVVSSWKPAHRPKVIFSCETLKHFFETFMEVKLTCFFLNLDIRSFSDICCIFVYSVYILRRFGSWVRGQMKKGGGKANVSRYVKFE